MQDINKTTECCKLQNLWKLVNMFYVKMFAWNHQLRYKSHVNFIHAFTSPKMIRNGLKSIYACNWSEMFQELHLAFHFRNPHLKSHLKGMQMHYGIHDKFAAECIHTHTVVCKVKKIWQIFKHFCQTYMKFDPNVRDFDGNWNAIPDLNFKLTASLGCACKHVQNVLINKVIYQSATLDFTSAHWQARAS